MPGRKDLLKSDMEYEVVLIDVTETVVNTQTGELTAVTEHFSLYVYGASDEDEIPINLNNVDIVFVIDNANHLTIQIRIITVLQELISFLQK